MMPACREYWIKNKNGISKILIAMHEFSLAENIIEIATTATTREGKTKVVKVTLEVGEISGVEESALYTALENIKVGTMLSDAVFETIIKEGKAVCKSCNTVYILHELYSLCPKCGSFSKEILSGKELNVLAIEAE